MTGGAAPARKGSQFERDVVTFLRDHGHPYVERAYGAGRADDKGDLDGIPGWCLELKACRSLELGPWMDELAREQSHAHAPNGALIIKRRMHATSDAFVVLDLGQFAQLLKDQTL